MTEPWGAAHAAGDLLRTHLDGPVDIAVVLGSGWGPVADALGTPVVELPLGGLPGFVAPSVPGHDCTLRLVEFERSGDRDPLRVAVVLGRVHLYEGHDPATVVHPIRALAEAGAKAVVLTNAAGALDAAAVVGGPVLIADHLNHTGCSPLTGPEPPNGRPSRFVDLTDLYSPRLREQVQAAEPGIPMGVYAGLAGPHFETPAEIRALRTLGADLVGFSTVLEAIAARHLGLEVLGISLVTNLAAGLSPAVSDQEVFAEAVRAAPRLGELLGRVLTEC